MWNQACISASVLPFDIYCLWYQAGKFSKYRNLNQVTSPWFNTFEKPEWHNWAREMEALMVMFIWALHWMFGGVTKIRKHSSLLKKARHYYQIAFVLKCLHSTLESHCKLHRISQEEAFSSSSEQQASSTRGPPPCPPTRRHFPHKNWPLSVPSSGTFPGLPWTHPVDVTVTLWCTGATWFPS